MSKAGEFEISVGEAYPVWCKITYKGITLASIHHSELSDLRYAIEKAMSEAKSKLGPERAGEVDWSRS